MLAFRMNGTGPAGGFDVSSRASIGTSPSTSMVVKYSKVTVLPHPIHAMQLFLVTNRGFTMFVLGREWSCIAFGNYSSHPRSPCS